VFEIENAHLGFVKGNDTNFFRFASACSIPGEGFGASDRPYSNGADRHLAAVLDHRPGALRGSTSSDGGRTAAICTMGFSARLWRNPAASAGLAAAQTRCSASSVIAC
jgi:hypothetical protein